MRCIRRAAAIPYQHTRNMLLCITHIVLSSVTPWYCASSGKRSGSKRGGNNQLAAKSTAQSAQRKHQRAANIAHISGTRNRNGVSVATVWLLITGKPNSDVT